MAINNRRDAENDRLLTSRTYWKYGYGNNRCPTEVFSGLKPSSLIVCLSLKRIYKDDNGIDDEWCRRATDIGRAHEVLRQMYKEVCNNNNQRRSRAQQVHNDRTNVLPISIEIGDYVMIHTHAKRNHKLKSLWRGPMKVVDSKSSLSFAVEDITTRQCVTVHAQRMVSYPATRIGEQVS